jgi:pimeloyl-ACP methyl ester carboxylesterase
VQRVAGIGRRVWTIGDDLADAASRTVAYARGLGRDPDTAADSVLRRVGLTAAAAADELLLATFRQLRAPTGDEGLTSNLEEAAGLVAYLDRNGLLATPEKFHRAPPPAVMEVRMRRVGGTRFGHATYASPYSPDADIPGATRFARDTDNHVVHAWILRQTVRAPWVVCLHGAGMGDPLADMFAFRAAHLHSCGFNVAIPVLPHHGPRGAGRFEVAFPSDDLAVNLHAAAQAIADVRALLSYITMCEEPATLFGISLGAYVAATVAALEPTLTGVIVGVPVVDISDLMRTHAPSRFLHHPLFDDFYAIAQQLEGVTSALALPAPAQSSRTRSIWAGRADRLVRPSQVRRLIEHWGDPKVCWYAGGHMGFLAARSVQRHISNALVETGVAEDRKGRLAAARLNPPWRTTIRPS